MYIASMCTYIHTCVYIYVYPIHAYTLYITELPSLSPCCVCLLIQPPHKLSKVLVITSTRPVEKSRLREVKAQRSPLCKAKYQDSSTPHRATSEGSMGQSVDYDTGQERGLPRTWTKSSARAGLPHGHADATCTCHTPRPTQQAWEPEQRGKQD